MAKRIFYFVVVLTLGISGEIFGQKIPQQRSFEMRREQAFQQYTGIGDDLLVKDFQKNFKAFQKNIEKWRINEPGYPFATVKAMVLLQPGWYSSQLSFFCKNELLLEKATNISLRLRLGSQDYVDYLEQKPNSVFRQ